jgi:hypothetical protein
MPEKRELQENRIPGELPSLSVGHAMLDELSYKDCKK